MTTNAAGVGFDDWDDTTSTNTGEDDGAGLSSEELRAAVQDAVTTAVRRRVEAIAARALDDALDDTTLTQLQDAAATAARTALAQEPEAGEAQLVYATLPEFVEGFLLPMYRRALGGPHRTWCPDWWRHPEAVYRLDALWRSWEHLRHDPALGASTWLRDHADHHMGVLLDADGPLKGCKEEQHNSRPLRRLATQASPTSLWPAV